VLRITCQLAPGLLRGARSHEAKVAQSWSVPHSMQSCSATTGGWIAEHFVSQYCKAVFTYGARVSGKY
jgi:hypothetical protein